MDWLGRCVVDEDDGEEEDDDEKEEVEEEEHRERAAEEEGPWCESHSCLISRGEQLTSSAPLLPVSVWEDE